MTLSPSAHLCVKGKIVLPKTGKAYLARQTQVKGLIHDNGYVVKLFKKYGIDLIIFDKITYFPCDG